MNRPAIAALALAAVAAFTGKPAAAHPLGNFTINHLSKIAIERDRIDRALRPRHGGDSDVRRHAFARPRRHVRRAGTARVGPRRGRADRAVAGADDRRRPARADPRCDPRHARRGAGGLPTLYFVADLHARDLAAERTRSRTPIAPSTGRLGWKDVVVAPRRADARVDVAIRSALLGSPRGVTTAISASLRAARSPSAPLGTATDVQSAAAPSAAPVESALGPARARDRQTRPSSSDAAGRRRARRPPRARARSRQDAAGGLAGRARATIRRRGILASALTIAHTAGVLALGIAIIAFKNYFVPETIYPWITLDLRDRDRRRSVRARSPVRSSRGADSLTPTITRTAGCTTTITSTRTTRTGRTTHDDGHVHAHDDLEHARSHAMPGEAPLRFGPTVWAAMSGGVRALPRPHWSCCSPPSRRTR